MLKSLELKADIKALKGKIQAMIDAQQEVPADMQSDLQAKLDAYEKQVDAEAKAKVIENKGAKEMDKKVFNKALKAYLLGIRNEETAKFFAAAEGQNGATAADGGVLIPSELLDLKENNVVNNDLRTVATGVDVGTRTGSVPIIDYSQSVELTDFDENNDISETKATFTSAKFNLASKGAIIPVSRELLMDVKTDVMGVIGKLFNRVYVKAVNKAILAAASADITPTTVTALASKAGLDAIKKAVIALPMDAGANATIIINQKTFAEMATLADKQDRYLLARDANGGTIRQLEGRPVIVVEDDELADNTVLVGDFRAVYHIAYPELEVAADESAGFRKNSVLVRAICRFTDINTYTGAFAIVKQG